MAEFASKGVAGTGLGLGIAGTALGLMAGGLNGGWFNGGCNNAAVGCCSENSLVNRYELQQEQKIASLESQVALRDANIFTDSKINELGVQTRAALDGIRAELRDIAVYQATNTATISCLSGQVAGIQGVLANLTKTVIPSSNICAMDPTVIVGNTACNPVITKTVTA